MRTDSFGFFWEDKQVIKEKKAPPPKPVPPEKIWELPGYLPNFEKACAYRPVEMTDDEVLQAAIDKHRLEYDIECYRNYAMFGFFCEATGKYILLEKIPEIGQEFDLRKLKWVLQNFEFQTFNGRGYDIPMSEAALAGFDCEQLKAVSDYIIQPKFTPLGEPVRITATDVRKHFKLKKLYATEDRTNKRELNHIDLKEVCPGQASLKAYSARMHTKLMQDLPFHHASSLSLDQIQVLRWYHGNDLQHTAEIRKHLKKEMDLRIQLSSEYGVDVRSKSDAQIAEAVLSQELFRHTGKYPEGTSVAPGTTYKFKPAPWLKFQHPNMQYVFDVVCNLEYEVGMSGRVFLPDALDKMLIPLGTQNYQMGIGGLHSTEKKTAHFARDGYLLADTDVESFYPMLMLLLNIFPERHPLLSNIFKGVVDRRLAAKHRGDKSTANSLKIVVNGTYGKLGEKHSIVYMPDGIIQVCLNGQLSLLMLIERLVMAGIEVVSANTDGVVSKPHESQYELFQSIVKQWQAETALNMEETRYSMLLSRDVNNYIAIKDGNAVIAGKKQSKGWKGKGAYMNFWHEDSLDHNEQLKHNPTALASQEAVIELLKNGTPIEDFIRKCNDVSKYVTVRKVDRGGAYKNGNFLGKTIRYYFATNDQDPIIVVDNGHKVGNTLGAQPLMEMVGEMPADLDKQWYVDKAYKILKEVAYLE